MMIDAKTVAQRIRHTVLNLKSKNRKFEKNEPGGLILVAFEELAKSFDEITEAARTEALEQRSV